MCPIYKCLGREEASPRAKANLIRSLLFGKLPLKEAKPIIELCINCKMCCLECPAGVDIPKLVRWAKAQMPLSLRNRLFEIESLLKFGSLTAPLSNSFLKQRGFRLILETLLGIDRRRSLKFERRSLKGQTGQRSNTKVAFFHGCYVNYIDPEIGEAFIDVLTRRGVEVVVPKQRCCGISALADGNLSLARKKAEYNIEALLPWVEKGYEVVTTCPSCCLGLREEISIPVTYAAEYLMNLDINFKETKLKVAYHIPCHERALGSSFLKILKLLPGLELKEVDDCCGMAGTFGIKNFDLSMAIGQKAFETLKEMKKDVIITPCGGCEIQIKEGIKQEVIHPIELISKGGA
jgi:Fe-S oxidoreductase